jgi:multimeric flavodoxin WrbA
MRIMSISGSARRDGNTAKLLMAAIGSRHVHEVDLLNFSISHYDYSRMDEADGFLEIVTAMQAHDVIVFATPVYWYSMSGRMKVFFDRFTDLVSVHKELGRGLRGKTTCLVASGTDPLLPEGFEVPFRDTSRYLGMIYAGCLYGKILADGTLSPDVLSQARMFGDQIFSDQS